MKLIYLSRGRSSSESVDRSESESESESESGSLSEEMTSTTTEDPEEGDGLGQELLTSGSWEEDEGVGGEVGSLEENWEGRHWWRWLYDLAS